MNDIVYAVAFCLAVRTAGLLLVMGAPALREPDFLHQASHFPRGYVSDATPSRRVSYNEISPPGGRSWRPQGLSSLVAEQPAFQVGLVGPEAGRLRVLNRGDLRKRGRVPLARPWVWGVDKGGG